MKYPLRSRSPALATFVLTVVLAVVASATTLLPQQSVQVVDSQVHKTIEQLLPAEMLN
ncbi:hypothetical protein [Melaminivora sp.]|uniref:hypothetical protein n=1 Tax=Melaminivora sp. TaxID=1933032 RepID=UPI0028AB76F4|nr:hypothetical protein [Melaminivora sp.]